MFLLLLPRASSAIDLRWNDGSLARSFTEATRCTLEVRADSTEQQLSAEWRLLWVADTNTVVTPIPLSTSFDCEADVAEVESLDAPANAADSAAHLLTAHFCSTGETAATLARYALDLAAGSSGKLKIVALDPEDSSAVLSSNEVTFNGGRSDEYPAVVLRATSVHQSLRLEVTAIGSGLGSASSLALMATDSSWTIPLVVTSRSDVQVTGTALAAALIPACEVAFSSAPGKFSSVALAADEEPVVESPQSCLVVFNEELLWPAPIPLGYTIQPKDFAFTRGFVDESTNRYALHLFYIRQNYWYYQPPESSQYWHPELTAKNFGHIWTTDFNSWYGPDGLNKPDTLGFAVRNGKFDELHVWAPTIVQRGPVFYMFYTGVRDENNKQHQRIGLATSTDLNTWTRQDDPVLTAPDIPWAKKDPSGQPYSGAQQLRDPFVMEDPVNPGQWLMYFAALDSCELSCTPTMAVGVAKSADLYNWDPLPDPFASTQRPTIYGTTRVVESPHVFRHNGQWWMPYTVNNDQVFFETTTSADPADTVAAHWSDPVWLRGVTEGEPPPLRYWHATEYLRIGATEYLGAWNDNLIGIDIKGIFAPANPAVDSLLLDCPDIADISDLAHPRRELRLSVSSVHSGSAQMRLRLELPARMTTKLAVYDIAGRRRATLLERELPAGITDLAWDGRDADGRRMASGVYFLRLATATGARVSKVAILR